MVTVRVRVVDDVTAAFRKLADACRRALARSKWEPTKSLWVCLHAFQPGRPRPIRGALKFIRDLLAAYAIVAATAFTLLLLNWLLHLGG